ncbi:phosphonopyruvate decarboxylase [Methanobrevibacter sp.]|uniref:phosphonopyruvate decarboxylase n=1 Tax=Methanobrevibacter sp. TaxID=66852 RepID=UPI00386E76AE
MKVEDFVSVLGCDFYTGVPDSQLKALCNYLMNVYGIDEKHHVIAANEGNCTALAAGYHLATGKVPLIYMQNSGEGNIINPVASLLNDKVYAIPAIFVIGWRGQPGIHDEPQHIYQGQITCDLLDLMDIQNFTIDKDTTVDEIKEVMRRYDSLLKSGKQVAFVIKKGALTYGEKIEYKNDNEMIREEIISHIVKMTGENPIVSTTGKASRELFEIRERNNQSHKYDFLTVGSMGHTSSIALGVAINKPNKKIWCIDGDGSALMHLGAIAVVGNVNPSNLVHIVINNEAHETVGGMPTVANTINLIEIAKACGYGYVSSVDNFEDLDIELEKAKDNNQLSFIEIKSSIGAREDLGRPTTTAIENKENFMEFLNK